MAIFRVEKAKRYLFPSNHHLKNEKLSLNAKGLLSQILSLPEDWDYTCRGLNDKNPDSMTTICDSIHELEKEGYIIRTRERRDNGQYGKSIYIVREQPPEFIAPASLGYATIHNTQTPEYQRMLKPTTE